MTDRQKAGDAVRFKYTNHRGQTRIRTVRIGTLVFKKTEWHPEFQWFVRGWDDEQKAVREFALKDCDFTTTELPSEVTKVQE